MNDDTLEAELMGVMYSVDKWLDGDDLRHPPAHRAALAREVALKAIEEEQRRNKELRESLAEAITEVEDLRWLVEYARHVESCATEDGGRCSCGFYEASSK